MGKQRRKGQRAGSVYMISAKVVGVVNEGHGKAKPVEADSSAYQQ